jgi:hypothetical protein
MKALLRPGDRVVRARPGRRRPPPASQSLPPSNPRPRPSTLPHSFSPSNRPPSPSSPPPYQVCCYPAYQSLYELALSTGCSLDFWEPDWDGASGAARFDVGRLEALLGTGDGSGGGGGGKAGPVRLVVVNFPHNPTGATLPAAEQARLVAACAAAGAYLFSDEMYWMSGERQVTGWRGAAGHGLTPLATSVRPATALAEPRSDRGP